MASPFVAVTASLIDLLGEPYCHAAAEAAAVLTGVDPHVAHELARRPVEFLPDGFVARQEAMLSRVGSKVSEPAASTATGATTRKFTQATHTQFAPLSAAGMFRVGEDGRLYLITKSEHYHVPLGHSFPGWQLIECARRLGVPNATHNNTRGHITRLLEEQLVDMANAPGEEAKLDRVLNLETGSLALEAAIKLCLARFYQVQSDSPDPEFRGATPVFLVMGDSKGDLTANYHGTTITAQTLRGMWPELCQKAAQSGMYEIHTLKPNDTPTLELAFDLFSRRGTRIAGVFCELILMNYGAQVLTPSYAQALDRLCREYGVPLVVDEIQTGLWNPQLLMSREYGTSPGMVALGKGFPGGEYAASRLLLKEQWDQLPQFGALVTNGQEELASLAYLIGMRWAMANADVTAAIGDYLEKRVRELGDKHAGLVTAVHGRRHLLGIHFSDLARAKAFVHTAQGSGLDISVQTYKTSVTPAALMKLPLIATKAVVDCVIERLDRAMKESVTTQ